MWTSPTVIAGLQVSGLDTSMDCTRHGEQEKEKHTTQRSATHSCTFARKQQVGVLLFTVPFAVAPL